MKFVFDSAWVAALWNAVKTLADKKQDKISGQEIQRLLSGAWPDGPYTFEITDDGHLLAEYAGVQHDDAEPGAPD